MRDSEDEEFRGSYMDRLEQTVGLPDRGGIPTEQALRLASVVGTQDLSGTRSSDRWRKYPGAWDSCHVFRVWPTDNEWGIPSILPDTEIDIPRFLVPYGTKLKDQTPTDGCTHFFLDDHRIETVWNRPHGTLLSVSNTGSVLSPDYSIWRDWPLVVQLWNIYRSRWCARWWQSHGLRVIPTVSWSSRESFAWCFSGLPKGTLLAVSSVGIYPRDEPLFREGYLEMLRRCEPQGVLWYGKELAVDQGVPIYRYPDRWTSIREARKAQGLPERPPKQKPMSRVLFENAQLALSQDKKSAGRGGGSDLPDGYSSSLWE